MTDSSLPTGRAPDRSPIDPDLDRRLLRFADDWSDRSVASQSSARAVAVRVGPWTPSELSHRLGRAMESTGFRVAMSDFPPELPVGPDGQLDRLAAVRQIMLNPQRSSPTSALSGLVVGERALHVDVAGRRRAVRMLSLLGLLTLILIPGGFLLGYSPEWRDVGALGYVLGAACGIAAVFTLGWTRVYDSELLVISYRAGEQRVSRATGDRGVPQDFELAVGCLRACSRNAGGKFPGRTLRRVLPTSPELAAVVPQAVDLLGQP